MPPKKMTIEEKRKAKVLSLLLTAAILLGEKSNTKPSLLLKKQYVPKRKKRI